MPHVSKLQSARVLCCNMEHPNCWLIVALFLCVTSSHEDATFSPAKALDLKVTPSVSFVSDRNITTVVCPVGSALLPNGTHRFVLAPPPQGKYIRLKFNGTLGAIPKHSAFEGEGLKRVRVLDMSHQGIRTIKRMDSDTFQLFRESVVNINLTFNAIVNIDSDAFDGFRPPRPVQVDLSDNAGLSCKQICFLLALRRAFVEYKGECEDVVGRRLSFNSQTFAVAYCQGTDQDGDVVMETTKYPITRDQTDTTAVPTGQKPQSGSSISSHSSDTAIYIAVGVIAGAILILVIISVVAFGVFKRRKNIHKRDSISRSVVMNINPTYEQRTMSGVSAKSRMSQSSENILYVPAARHRSETLNSNNPLYSSEETRSSDFHIYEEADSIRNVSNPVYDSSGEE